MPAEGMLWGQQLHLLHLGFVFLVQISLNSSKWEVIDLGLSINQMLHLAMFLSLEGL
jgi:hypothetical protein